MDLALSEEQSALLDSVRALVEDIFPTSAARACETDSAAARPIYQGLFALGLGGILAPESVGGLGLGMAEMVVVQSELGRALVPGLFTQTTAGAVPALAAIGDAGLRDVLATLIDGTAMATCALDDESAATIHASAAGDAFILTGTRALVPEAVLADWLLIEAVDGGEPVLCLAERNASGLALAPQANLADQDLSILTLAQTPVRLVARGAQATEAIRIARRGLALAFAAQAAGGAARILEMTRDYACTRQQFGQPIGAFQAIAHMIADGAVHLEGAAMMVHRAAAAIDDGEPGTDTWVDMAKLKACQTYRDISAMAIQVHGGIGFTLEADPQLFFRRAKHLQLIQGEPLDLMERTGAAMLSGAHKVLENHD